MMNIKSAGFFPGLVLLIIATGGMRVMATDLHSDQPSESFELAQIPVFTKEQTEEIVKRGAATEEEIENFFAEDGITSKRVIGSDGKSLGWRYFLTHNGQEILPGSMVVMPDSELFINETYNSTTHKKVPDLQEGIRIENTASGHRTIYPNGVMIQKIIDPNTRKSTEVRYFGPEGQELQRGQTVLLRDGSRFVYPVY
jgi:hypothetical protein